MRTRENEAGVRERHYGFQRFNLIRRTTREWIVSGYRNYTEYTSQAESTYKEQVELIAHALVPYIRWQASGSAMIQTEGMRVSTNPVYLLHKSRSMKSGMQYFWHFALLDMLSGGRELTLAEIQRKLGNGFSSADADRMDVPSELLEHFDPRRPYELAAKEKREELEKLLINLSEIVRRGDDGKYRLTKNAKAQLAEHPTDLAVAMVYILSGKKALTIAGIQKELNSRAKTFFDRYGKKDLPGKTALLSRLEKYYLPAGILKKNPQTKRYALSPLYLDDLLKRYPGLKNALAFYAEYSPFGMIGSCLMDAENLQDDSIVFKNEYIVQALDAIVLYDVLRMIRDRQCIEVYTEHVSDTMLEKSRVFPIKVLSSATDGRRYLFAYDLTQKKYCTLRLDYIYDILPCKEDLPELPVDQIIEDGLQTVKHLWASFVGDSTFPVQVRMRNSRPSFEQEITREKRTGTVTMDGQGDILFECEVYQPKELATWLLSHMGDVASLEVGRNRKGNKDSSRLINRYTTHLKSLHQTYHGAGIPRDTIKYKAVSHPFARQDELNQEQKACLEYVWAHRKEYKAEAELRKLICAAKAACGVVVHDAETSPEELLKYRRFMCISTILHRLRGQQPRQKIISVICQAKKQFSLEDDQTISFKRLVEDGLLKRPMKYPPVDMKKLKSLRLDEDSSPMFHAVRSKYIHCFRHVLMQTAQPHTKKEIEAIIKASKTKYGINPLDKEVSFDSMHASGMLQEYNYHQQLLGKPTDDKYMDHFCSYLLEADEQHALRSPLMTHEAAWIRTILEDEKIQLFLSRSEMDELKKELGGYELLYNPEDILCLDRYQDGDSFENPQYQQAFQILQQAIHSDTGEVGVLYQTEKEKRAGLPALLYHIKPLRLEYSKLSDKFHLIGMFTQPPPENSTLIERGDSALLTPRLSNIFGVHVSNQANILPAAYEEAVCAKPLSIRVFNIYNAVERFMLMFSSYRKEVQYEPDTDTCLTKVWYSKRDENELLNKVCSLGCAVEVIGPPKVRKTMTRRVDDQYDRMLRWTESASASAPKGEAR